MKKTAEQQAEHLIDLHSRLAGSVLGGIEYALITASIGFEFCQNLPMDGKASNIRKEGMLYWLRVSSLLNERKSNIINYKS
jgi:hypothetical protein